MIQSDRRATTHQDLLAAPASERAAIVEAYLLASVRGLAGEAGGVSPDSRLSDLAIDSIQAVGLKVGLDRLLGVELDPELMVANPTLRELAARSVAATGLA